MLRALLALLVVVARADGAGTPYDAPVADFEAIAAQYPIFWIDPA